MPEDTEAPLEKKEHLDRIVFVGLRDDPLSTGKGTYVFYKLSPEQHSRATHGTLTAGELTDRLLYEENGGIKKGFKALRPGAIYAVTHSGDTIQYVRGHRPVAFVTGPLRLQWDSAHRAIERSRDAQLKLKQEGARNVVKEQCAPLARTYRSLVGGARSQFIAEVVAYITTQTRKETT